MRRMPAGSRPAASAPSATFAEQLVVQGRVLAARADEAVADAARQLGGERPGRGHVDRHRGLGPVVDRGLRGPVVVALEVHALLGPQLPDQPDGLRQPQAALLAAGELLAGGGRLVQRLAGAHAEEHPAGGEAAERGERLRHHRRVVAQRGGEDARAEHGALGGHRGRAEPGERRRSVAAVMAPGLEVVGDADQLEPDLLGLAGVVEQRDRVELLGRCLVAEATLTRPPAARSGAGSRTACRAPRPGGPPRAPPRSGRRARASRRGTTPPAG